MDLSRSGEQIDNLNDWEVRRLENEHLVLDYLTTIKPFWVKNKKDELKIPAVNAEKLFSEYVEKELGTII
jgi:hypothetical protein